MRQPEPVLIADLFQPERDALLELLRGLEPAEWQLPTACEGWTVKDVALHILGGDVGIVSRKRDGFAVPLPDAENFVESLNRLNDIWIAAARRFSEPLLIDLLEHIGPQAFAVFRELDPFATGQPIYWAGPEPAPVWLDVAREYTERWHHQQHIRDAAGRPGLLDARFAAPVLRTFAFSLPWSYRDVNAPDGTCVEIRVTGPAGGSWVLARGAKQWELGEGEALEPDVTVSLPDDVAWRMFTRGISPEAAESQASVHGNLPLARPLFEARAIIV